MGVEETPITVSYDPKIKCTNVTCEKCRSTFSIPDEVKVYNFCPKCGSKWNLTSRQMEYILHEQMYFKDYKDDGGDYE
jgi:PHP family Zn ribbon phosphoesterase